MTDDGGIGEYYASKDKEARRLIDEIKAAQIRGDSPEKIRSLQKRLELAQYVGD